MQEKHKSAPSAGFNLNLGDIYHVLFRHKWKIIAVWVTGLVAAAVLHMKWPVPYSSEAVLFIRYVKDNKDVNLTGSDPQNIVQTSPSADSVIRTEIEMLQNLDVAKAAAETLGAEAILKLTGTTNIYLAAALIRDSLQIEIPYRSPVMHVYFKNGDPEIVQSVLDKVILSYFDSHRKVHQLIGAQDETLTMQTDTLKAELAHTEAQLSDLKSTNQVTSLAETKKLNAETITKIKEDLWAAETELAVHQAVLNSYTNLASIKTDTNAPSKPVQPPAEKVSDYQDLCTELDRLKSRRSQLRLDFQDQNPRVVTVQEQIDRTQKLKSQLENEYPQLTTYRIMTPGTDGRPAAPGMDLAGESAKLLAIQTRISRLKQHLQDYKDQTERITAVESNIKNLERQRDTQEANLTTFERRRFDEKIEEEMSNGKLSNIKIIQQPSPPYTDPSKRTKIVRAVVLGALAAGLALAFVIEFYFDRSFKRPIEIETKLGLPLFLSIPESNRNGKHRLSRREVRLLTTGDRQAANGAPDHPPAGELMEPGPWRPNAVMQPFFEALRDRLITHFEIKEINHKPKLVAVTSCTPGSGVSTVASGLAASLSETGEGNVLLVDMNTEKGAAHFFHKGSLHCGLDEVLEKDANRENAQVEKNLFVVSESTSDEKLPRILHKRFSALIPKLHASDFDYIIFDMPPISQTSATTRVARFMDMVFMVVEAEKTDRDVVKRASQMLKEAKATDVGVVLNKSHNYVPGRLNQEL